MLVLEWRWPMSSIMMWITICLPLQHRHLLLLLVRHGRNDELLFRLRLLCRCSVKLLRRLNVLLRVMVAGTARLTLEKVVLMGVMLLLWRSGAGHRIV